MDNQTSKDIATVLVYENFSNLTVQNIINKYNVSYILTRSYDKLISGIFLKAAGYDINDSAEGTLVYQMWEDEPNISGLTMRYNNAFFGSSDPDINTGIFRLFSIDK